jgi:hypothetical protein
MKLQPLCKLFFISCMIILASCDDAIKEVGFTIQPGNDRITVFTDTLPLQASTIMVDKMFAKTKNPILGEYVDPLFGTIKSDYVGEFYYPEGESFQSGAVIDSVRLSLFFDSWAGDSLAPMEVSVYEVIKTLPQYYYTDFDPKEYISPTPLGKTLFTAANIELSEEEKKQTDYRMAVVNLPNSLGQRMLDNPDSLIDTETFKDFFKGLYITTSFGSGTIIKVAYTYFLVHYHYPGKSPTTDADTTFTDFIRLNFSPEVTQINSIQNRNDQLLVPSETKTYIKSPAGVNTEIVFPFSQISDKLQALNQANLKIYAIPDDQTNLKFKLSPPNYLLLINKDSLNGFFERRKMPDNITSFYASFNKTEYSYDFSNISELINHYKKINDGKIPDLTYYLIPVDISFTTQSVYYGQTYQIPNNFYNLMTPSAVTLNKAFEDFNLKLIFSEF